MPSSDGMRKVFLDAHLVASQDATRRAHLDTLEANPQWRDGPASPRWVSCSRCGAYRGDECHTGEGYCVERREENRRRLLALPTYAAPFHTPCCRQLVWLVWRTTADELRWTGVPCFKCEKTYTIDRHASDDSMVDDRVIVDRVHPHLVEVVCWALAEEPEENR